MTFSTLKFVAKTHIGRGALSQLVNEMEQFQARKVLLITDEVLHEIGLTQKIIEPLTNEGYDVAVFTKVIPEPPVVLADEIVQYMKNHQFDAVIGLGGGSALDLAKLAAVLVHHEGHTMDYLNLTQKREITEKGLPKILIPTTSGTGSEVTNIAVLSLGNTKDVVVHDHLLADVAIVDPVLTLTMPKNLTVATGVDALTHAIEAYLSNEATPATDALALEAVKLIGRSLKKAAENGNDELAKEDMSYGSYLAGQAFFNAGVGGVHALAYPLGGQFNIPHGESNAVLLIYVLQHIRGSCREKMSVLYKALTGDEIMLNVEDASVQFIRAVERLLTEIEAPLSLQVFDIPKIAIEQLTTDALKQKRLLARSPMPLGALDIQVIYEAAYEGKLVK